MKNFLLCLNPLAIMPAGTLGYIYHAERPRFFAGILEIDYTRYLPVMHFSGANILFRYFQGDGKERILLIVVMTSFDKTGDQLGTLHNAAAWYTACLNKEDEKKYGAASTWSPLVDYHKKTPGLQVLQISQHNQFFVSYKLRTFSGIKLCHSIKEVDDFLYTLGYTADKVGGGSLNEV
jgi:hypothetical protein